MQPSTSSARNFLVVAFLFGGGAGDAGGDVLTTLNRKRVFDYAGAHHIPALYEYDVPNVHDGGLMSYGPDLTEAWSALPASPHASWAARGRLICRSRSRRTTSSSLTSRPQRPRASSCR